MSTRMQDNFKTHEFVRWLQPADTCDVAAPERGCSLTSQGYQLFQSEAVI